ncbi:MAG: hypothetical protein AAF993_22775, partial [Pseudomonadota bacterium]
YRSNPDQMQSLEMGVLEDQVVDHILSLAAVENLDSNYEEVISGRAIAPPEAEDADTEASSEAGAEVLEAEAADADETGAEADK